MDEIEAPGLIWQKRRVTKTPYWRAPLKSGFATPQVNLRHLIGRPEEIVAQCVKMEAEFAAWKKGMDGKKTGFNGTIGTLLKKYQTDEDSPYFSLRPGSRHPYDHYIQKLSNGIGKLRVDKITGIDMTRWHVAWSDNGKRLAASKMQRAVLDAALAYGVMSRLDGCAELREVLKTASRKLPSPRRREFTVTADDVVRLRAAAHAEGRPSSALVYAMVFETTLRLWDVIGQWVPIDSPGISDITRPRLKKKWFGLRWDDINENMVLRFTPSKTSLKTGIGVTFPLDRAPMVMEELKHWPEAKRQGPVIVYEGTGEPYFSNYFGEKWAIDRKAAGIPKHIWARDLRASGITEARAAGISTDDAAKVAGHTSTKTTAAVYDRASLEAAERFADARTERRRTKQ